MERLACEKAASIRQARSDIIVGADTVVVLDDKVIGKPRDDSDALAILSALAGRTHHVLTGYCVRRGSHQLSGVVTSEVCFRPLKESEIYAYVTTGEGRDKAGAYGIQSAGAALIDHVEGSFSNVVGLPLTEVLAAIRELREQN